MLITIKRNEKKIQVDVSNKECINYECLVLHKYQHRSYNETEGSMINSDKYYSCATRNYHGCPEIKELKCQK